MHEGRFACLAGGLYRISTTSGDITLASDLTTHNARAIYGGLDDQSGQTRRPTIEIEDTHRICRVMT